MKHKKLTLFFFLYFFTNLGIGCSPTLYTTPSVKAPDGTSFFSIITRTHGHPAQSTTQTYRQVADGQPAVKVADHAAAARGAGVDIISSGLQGTGAAAMLTLPASVLRPDRTTNTNTAVAPTKIDNKVVNKPVNTNLNTPVATNINTPVTTNLNTNRNTNTNTNPHTNINTNTNRNEPTATATGIDIF